MSTLSANNKTLIVSLKDGAYPYFEKWGFYYWKLIISLCRSVRLYWMRYFETKFLDEANEFIAGLDPKAIRKIFYNIDLAEQTNDPKLFKKLRNDIWEFRTKFAGHQIRLLAFWDKTPKKQTLVIATHGFIKKVDKVPANEIDRAVNLRVKYFRNKQKM